MVLALMLVGLVLAGYALRQVGRLLREAEQAPARLDALVDELVATAEATTATVVDRAEALGQLLVAADERIAALRAAQPAAAPAHVPPATAQVGFTAPPAPAPAPSLAEVVGARAAAGQDEATIARELGLARTAVRLALQASKAGGGR